MLLNCCMHGMCMCQDETFREIIVERFVMFGLGCLPMLQPRLIGIVILKFKSQYLDACEFNHSVTGMPAYSSSINSTKEIVIDLLVGSAEYPAVLLTEVTAGSASAHVCNTVLRTTAGSESGREKVSEVYRHMMLEVVITALAAAEVVAAATAQSRWLDVPAPPRKQCRSPTSVTRQGESSTFRNMKGATGGSAIFWFHSSISGFGFRVLKTWP